MSLSEKWEDYKREIIFINEADEYSAQRNFYAGAAAVMFEDVSTDEQLRAEIDHFRSYK